MTAITTKTLTFPLVEVNAGIAPVPAERLANLSAIYAEHGPTVARWVLRLGGPGFEAADAVQEVFSIVTEGLSQFRGDSKLTTWLYGITENVVRQQRRRERVRRWFLGREAVEPAAPAFQPLETVERLQSSALVYRALDRLREPYRSALILFEMEELSGREIAELKHCKVATVWVWLHRARAQFLKHLTALTEPS